MKILYLYTEVMGYTLATIKELVKRGSEIHVVCWTDKKKTSFQTNEIPGVTFYPRESLSGKELYDLTIRINPSITVISGWMDRSYLGVAARLRSKGKTVVCGLDGQWVGSIRQRLASILGSFCLFNKFYSHIWVAGVSQYEFARRLGFDSAQIIYDLYSADLNQFNAGYKGSAKKKAVRYPHRFLFVGRLESVKGVDLLLTAWERLSFRRHDWELLIVGSGSLRSLVRDCDAVYVKNFLQPSQLVEEISTTGCFILPSRREPWGVVVHEFAAAGLPVLVSDVVGAANSFVINGYNGFIFQSESVEALKESMAKIIDLDDDELRAMGRRSHELSSRITPQTSAANLMSLGSVRS